MVNKAGKLSFHLRAADSGAVAYYGAAAARGAAQVAQAARVQTHCPAISLRAWAVCRRFVTDPSPTGPERADSIAGGALSLAGRRTQPWRFNANGVHRAYLHLRGRKKDMAQANVRMAKIQYGTPHRGQRQRGRRAVEWPQAHGSTAVHIDKRPSICTLHRLRTARLARGARPKANGLRHHSAVQRREMNCDAADISAILGATSGMAHTRWARTALAGRRPMHHPPCHGRGRHRSTTDSIA